jgi:gas vesicle protein
MNAIAASWHSHGHLILTRAQNPAHHGRGRGTQVAASPGMTRNPESSLVVFIMGMAVGAIAAALYTPTSGPALRRRLGRAAEEGAGMARDAVHHVDEFVREKSDVAKKAVSRSTDAFRKVRDEAASAAE